MNTIQHHLDEASKVYQKMTTDIALHSSMERVVQLLVETFTNGGRLHLCGNGGSASDAQHIAAEFTGKFGFDRPPFDAEALHVNGSYMTAVSNDYDFEAVYSRLLEAKGRHGDMLWAFSTSGNSENVLRACSTAQILGMHVVCFTGVDGGKMLDMKKDYILLQIPSSDTPHIQQGHISLGHAICSSVEQIIFPNLVQ